MHFFKLRFAHRLGGLLAGLGAMVTTLVGAALVAALLAVLADRARPARRRPALAPAGNVQAQSSAVR